MEGCKWFGNEQVRRFAVASQQVLGVGFHSVARGNSGLGEMRAGRRERDNSFSFFFLVKRERENWKLATDRVRTHVLCKDSTIFHHYFKEPLHNFCLKVLSEQVSHALELPLHHIMHRLEARWYIEAYSKRPDAKKIVLEIAKQDFTRVQFTLQMYLQ
ncbi:hypothetical protein DVH24_028231 [Malus domestica]|uniref:Uncharacterized protein n=1 Tax=Malus domestica TaxID=3750 RepID=A0A498HCS2_MALDO|nr:hypothetical protein DVH24_028231 [Malus domestica]